MDNHKITWDEKFSTGNEHVDSQHKQLIDIIGSLPNRSTEHDREVAQKALQLLSEYVDTHFSEEESWMKAIQYPALKSHTNQHKKLAKILSSYKRDSEKGKTDLYQFKQFMFYWIQDHIIGEDKKVAEYLLSADQE